MIYFLKTHLQTLTYQSIINMANTFTLDDYLPPPWSAPPSFKYYFEIIKDGCVLGKLPIKQKPFNLVGRLEDLCDVAIDNQTVSRKHAILQSKTDDPFLYLYDLGSAHGTFVNKEKLPIHTYKKLAPFDNVKFGVSSRIFILRCPEYEEAMDNEQAEKDNKFAEVIQNQHRQLSKEELKEKYLDMLENDPFFAANQAPRKLMGKQQVEEQDDYEGIDWGITDQRAVYAHKNDSDIPIQPDVLRRLNLDQNQLNKLADYEQHLRKYQEVEAELNELTGREKREYGLEEKSQAKKEKLEKRFMEALETVNKSEEWLRSNIFGEKVEQDKKNIVKIREKENDTFGDDEYLDRTLEKKEVSKEQAGSGEISTEDYWKLEKELKQGLKALQQLRLKMTQMQKMVPQAPEGNAQGKEQMDELQAFLQDNEMNLDNENMTILKREEELLLARIEQLKTRFKGIMGEEELTKMAAIPDKQPHRTLKDDYKQKSLEESIIQAKKRMEHNKNLQNLLNRLEAANQQDDEINQLDPSIFDYYKGRHPQQPQEEENFDLEDDEHPSKKRPATAYNPQKFERPTSKHVSFDTLNQKQSPIEEEPIDLTRKFQ